MRIFRDRLRRNSDEGSLALAIMFTIIISGILAIMLGNAWSSVQKNRSSRELTNVQQLVQATAQDAAYRLNNLCSTVTSTTECLSTGPNASRVPRLPSSWTDAQLTTLKNTANSAHKCDVFKTPSPSTQAVLVDGGAANRWGAWFLGPIQATSNGTSLASQLGGKNGKDFTYLYTVASYGGVCRVEVSRLTAMAVSSATNNAGDLAYALAPDSAGSYTLFASGDLTARGVISAGASPVVLGSNGTVTVPGNSAPAPSVHLFSSDGTRGDDNSRCVFTNATGCAPTQIETGVSLDSGIVNSYCESLRNNTATAKPVTLADGKVHWVSRDADASGNRTFTSVDSLVASSANNGSGTALCYNNVTINGSVSTVGAGSVNLFLQGNLTINNGSALEQFGSGKIGIYTTGGAVNINGNLNASLYASNATCTTTATGAVTITGSVACKVINLPTNVTVSSRQSAATIYLQDLYTPRLVWSIQKGQSVTGVGVR